MGTATIGGAQHMTAMYVGASHRFADEMPEASAQAARAFVGQQWQIMFNAVGLLMLVLGVCFIGGVLSKKTPYGASRASMTAHGAFTFGGLTTETSAPAMTASQIVEVWSTFVGFGSMATVVAGTVSSLGVSSSPRLVTVR